MGLDLLEFTLAVEDAFDMRIPDKDLEELTTPGKLINYLLARLPRGVEQPCLSQRIFYRLRMAVAARTGTSRSALRPDTSLLDLMPTPDRKQTWEAVRTDIGARKTGWPRLDEPGWLDFVRAERVGTLRQATQTLVARLPYLGKGENGWTRQEVAAVVHRLICENLGVNRNGYTEDSHWRNDMRVG